MKKANKTMDPQDLRKVNSIKNMYFNRYLMIRYFLAACIFANFYWMLSVRDNASKLFAIALLIVGSFACLESIRSYGEKKVSMKWTKRFFNYQLITNICLLVIVFTPFFKAVFPFLQDHMTSRIFISCLLIIGLLMCIACRIRLSKIDTNTDKHYARILQFEKIVNAKT